MPLLGEILMLLFALIPKNLSVKLSLLHLSRLSASFVSIKPASQFELFPLSLTAFVFRLCFTMVLWPLIATGIVKDGIQ